MSLAEKLIRWVHTQKVQPCTTGVVKVIGLRVNTTSTKSPVMDHLDGEMRSKSKVKMLELCGWTFSGSFETQKRPPRIAVHAFGAFQNQPFAPSAQFEISVAGKGRSCLRIGHSLRRSQ